ncbi:DNA-binding response regulator, OmpR family, contains REC and winged-helix (wHTH) domain [Clostridium grantii DSM 8605]|uniref:Stage 0 sporulation protein A homolog n=1 Tax=Clostridium grantii DSM 8605 TaxID=1121316 RepID=A0A1M5RMU7_9CLOT|nr:DNA-binding response regulator, OmpR family, contains REC and winged-helix (wHTH) domain [Clostridium grantii DSM 8605]
MVKLKKDCDKSGCYKLNKTILLVEDEERIRKLIKAYLTKEGYQCIEAENGVEALKKFKEFSVDLIVLDIMMPYMDGWTVCTTIRKESEVPIVILTAKAEEDDKLLGYELGADDYATKPFSPKVLVAKIKALLKRTTINEINIDEIIKYDKLEINNLSHEVSVDNEIINLSPKEYDLLIFFTKNIGIALSRDTILDKVWGFDYFGGLRTVDTNVKRLREKLGDMSEHIVTIRGSGYRFEVK